MTAKTTPRLPLLAAALGLALAVGARDASAQCGMGEVDWYAGERLRVSEAEDMLDQGLRAEAAGVIQSTWHEMHDARPVHESLPHIAEAVRVMALACVRSGGRVPSQFGWSSATLADRESNVRWGISRLRMLSRAQPDDERAKADLGEALSYASPTAAEALSILESIPLRSVGASAEAYAALARLRYEAGNRDGAATAVADCMRYWNSSDRCAPDPDSIKPTPAKT